MLKFVALILAVVSAGLMVKSTTPDTATASENNIVAFQNALETVEKGDFVTMYGSIYVIEGIGSDYQSVAVARYDPASGAKATLCFTAGKRPPFTQLDVIHKDTPVWREIERTFYPPQ